MRDEGANGAFVILVDFRHDTPSLELVEDVGQPIFVFGIASRVTKIREKLWQQIIHRNPRMLIANTCFLFMQDKALSQDGHHQRLLQVEPISSDQWVGPFGSFPGRIISCRCHDQESHSPMFIDAQLKIQRFQNRIDFTLPC